MPKVTHLISGLEPRSSGSRSCTVTPLYQGNYKNSPPEWYGSSICLRVALGKGQHVSGPQFSQSVEWRQWDLIESLREFSDVVDAKGLKATDTKCLGNLDPCSCYRVNRFSLYVILPGAGLGGGGGGSRERLLKSHLGQN